LPIGLIASLAIPALFNLGKSIVGGRALSKINRNRPSAPTYSIPPAVHSYLAQKQLQAQRGLPGQDVIESQIGANVAGTIGDVNRAASSSAAALGAVTDVRSGAQDAIRDLGVRSAEYQARQQDEAADAQRYMADYQEKEWEYNKNLPYQRKMNEWMSNRNAAMSNLWGGLEGIGSSVIQGAGNIAYQQQMQGLIDAIKGGYSPQAGVNNISSPQRTYLQAPNTMGYPSWQAFNLAQRMGGN